MSWSNFKNGGLEFYTTSLLYDEMPSLMKMLGNLLNSVHVYMLPSLLDLIFFV